MCYSRLGVADGGRPVFFVQAAAEEERMVIPNCRKSKWQLGSRADFQKVPSSEIIRAVINPWIFDNLRKLAS